MSIWSVLGSSKVVDTVADTVKGGLELTDKAFFTDQEKAEANAKMLDTWIKIQEATASENSIRSITRRVLAWMIMGFFVFCGFASCCLYRVDPGWSAYIMTYVVETDLHWLTLAVGCFYFGTYGIGNMMGKGKGK